MKIFQFFIAPVFVFSAMLTACEKESVISVNELPAAGRAFIEAHFTGVEIAAIVRETEGLGIEYSVYLLNGFEVDFTKSGEWDAVDGHGSSIPENILNLLPQSLTEYVANIFPNLQLVEVNKERYGYEIGLSNDLDLKFDSEGRFIGIDD
ncbi:MAG: PepSY-like domain-containing protein [Prevotellaceae bacterium]|jgi:hypothetical protein|nr:PepSY-like domain-containing protein [Prevotellaceae bacterium]